MQSVEFEGCNLLIGKGQPEYNVIHAKRIPGDLGMVVACFELSEEELRQVNNTKRIYYTRLTFGHPFQPMRLLTEDPSATEETEPGPISGLPCDFDINNHDKVIPV